MTSLFTQFLKLGTQKFMPNSCFSLYPSPHSIYPQAFAILSQTFCLSISLCHITAQTIPISYLDCTAASLLFSWFLLLFLYGFILHLNTRVIILFCCVKPFNDFLLYLKTKYKSTYDQYLSTCISHNYFLSFSSAVWYYLFIYFMFSLIS